MKTVTTMLLYAITIVTPQLASGASLAVVPSRASGVEGVDWFFGPGANEITLTHGDQNVELRVLVADWSPHTIAAADALLDCDSMYASIAGRVLASDLDCANGAGSFGVDFCIGTNVDETNPPYVLAPAGASIEACQNVIDCPDGLPGAYQCGAVVLFGDSGPDPGKPRYLVHFSFYVPGNVRGTAGITLLDTDDATFLINPMAEPIPVDEIIAAHITVTSGVCCNGTSPGCEPDTVEPDCVASGGVFIEDLGCDGPDNDNDSIPDLCDICPNADDLLDNDADGVPDACDPCPADNPDDPDNDGICTSLDICQAGNDLLDDDGDGTPDACDQCPGMDDAIYAPDCIAPVPTMSAWGLTVLALLLLIIGKLTRYEIGVDKQGR